LAEQVAQVVLDVAAAEAEVAKVPIIAAASVAEAATAS
jgi:hypothetical protein